ncbi:MAG: aminomethyl-transferring glycine dehydrogenase subunit GcvPA [Chloroflexi bacterium]|nr:aminomethyl-transferring glycine dehydrogenase subunit GcvPA [Chloroflexota bacterium]
MFHPHTENDRQEMLKAIGVGSLEDLFSGIPEKHRFPRLDLPEPLTEMEALAELQSIASENDTAQDLPCFLGAGAYHHYIPAVVDSILRRGEFYTAYTPYQPEISQGTLQVIFEYQSHIVNLTGMDVSNASHYDGATAAAEAINMAQAIQRGKRNKAVISPAVHPHYRATIDTYIKSADFEIVGGDLAPTSGPEALIPLIDQDTAVVMVQYPDFFGRLYDYATLSRATHELGALLAVVVNPIALAILKPPADFGADIVCGEGQSLGLPLSFGGPYLGILATKNEYVRTIAGRLVGETTDSDGKRGYVLTLSTREQHIRREKAGSNICTNQGLMALAATVYISLVGKEGLREVADLCYQKAHYAAGEISKLKGFALWHDGEFFHEFVVACPRPAEEINAHLLANGILGGYAVGNDYPEMENAVMFAVTEMNSREEIDYLVSVLAEVGDD